MLELIFILLVTFHGLQADVQTCMGSNKGNCPTAISFGGSGIDRRFALGWWSNSLVTCRNACSGDSAYPQLKLRR